MNKFVAFTVAAAVAAGSTVAMAQCLTCQQQQPVFSQPAFSAPIYSAPAAPIYSAPAAPIYSAPVVSAPIYSAPVGSAPVYSAPVQSEVIVNAPVASGCSSCNPCSACGGGQVIGSTVGQPYSYGGQQTLTVGAVINGETVVSVGETTIVGSTEQGNVIEGGNAIEGAVEPTSDGGEVVPMENKGEVNPPMPDTAEVTEGDA